jgi:DNA-binding winged helix-turn-helix (wHTH) protein
MAAYDTDADCRKVGGLLAPEARIYLCGRVTVERNGRVLTDAAFGGRQGRLLFAFLGTRRAQPVSKAQLIDAIWGTRTPPSVETAINALVSKLRAALRKLGVPRPHGVASDVGTYQFVVPSAWIDIEDARTSIDRAEGALRGNVCPTRGRRQMSLRRSRVSRSCRMKSTRGFSSSARSCSACGAEHCSCSPQSAFETASTSSASTMPPTCCPRSRSMKWPVRR